MRDRALLVFVAIVVLSIAGLVVAAAVDERQLAFTLGVQSENTVAILSGGEEVCQQPINVSAPFDRVAFRVDQRSDFEPPIGVEVRAFPGDRRLGGGEVRGPYPEGAVSEAVVGPISGVDRISVCFSPRDFEVGLWGGPAVAARTSTMVRDGRPVRKDLTLVFLRDEPRSVLALAPEMVRRATLFRPGWLATGVLWAVLAAVVTLVPLLLATALRSAR